MLARRVAAALLALAVPVAAPAARPTPSPHPSATAGPPRYDVLYRVLIGPECIADVRIEVDHNEGLLERLRLRIDPERHTEIEATGETTRDQGRLVWKLAQPRAELRYRVPIDHLRDEHGYDARCADSWALFRGEDLFPRVATRGVLDSAASRARLELTLPVGWKAVTPFPRDESGRYVVDQPDRDFDRPTGWILAGRLGINREKVAGVRLTIASPAGQHVHRLDMLALLRWTLPTLRKILPDLPERLLVVSARDPMWRGGLSGPGSLFLHADRPLITPDGTSPLLHEVLHVVTHARSHEDGDWAVEGMAELYSIELLRRSRTISKKRFRKCLARLAERGAAAAALRVPEATGAVTARAVTVLHDLDERIRRRSGGLKSLDDVLRALAASRQPVTTDRFRRLVERATGLGFRTFFRKYVPAPPRDEVGG